MKVLIVEDEKAAVRRLTGLLKELDADIGIAGITDTVKNTIRWFEEHDCPDIAFFDIQLADGNSFEVFEKTEVRCPVIFTTAYDQYALKAFEVNSIDYLLKPIDREKLARALAKYRRLTPDNNRFLIDPDILQNTLERIQGQHYKERYVVRYGDHIHSIPVEEICFFRSEAKAVFITLKDAKRYLVDYTLDQVVTMVDPNLFFRINRAYIIRIDAIRDIVSYSNSRLRLVLHVVDDPDMIVARERVTDFKAWLDR